jgi:hypothetical protein
MSAGKSGLLEVRTGGGGFAAQTSSPRLRSSQWRTP